MRSFVTYTVQQVLLGWSSERVWDGRDM